MEEDKQAICTALFLTLRRTYEYKDLVGLDYEDEEQIVTARFEFGREKRINVNMDSGSAMIRDIVNNLG